MWKETPLWGVSSRSHGGCVNLRRTVKRLWWICDKGIGMIRLWYLLWRTSVFYKHWVLSWSMNGILSPIRSPLAWVIPSVQVSSLLTVILKHLHSRLPPFSAQYPLVNFAFNSYFSLQSRFHQRLEQICREQDCRMHPLPVRKYVYRVCQHGSKQIFLGKPLRGGGAVKKRCLSRSVYLAATIRVVINTP